MIKVFYSDISLLNDIASYDEFCDKRKNYVSSITDVNRRKQSLYVWKLLLKVLKDLNIAYSGFSLENNKWELIDSNYKFSLSHSKNLVVVAVSDSAVGVDVEVFSDRLVKVCKRIFPKEIIPKDKTENSFYGELWVERECRIKNNNENQLFSTCRVFDEANNEYTVGLLSDQKINLIKIEFNKK